MKIYHALVGLAKKAAETALRMDANQTTCYAIYQPKIPMELSRFKKKKI